MRRFDELYGLRDLAGRRALLKIDVRGYEREVVGSMAQEVIRSFAAIEIEIPTVEIYAGSASFMEIFSAIADLGFVPYTIQSERWHGEGHGVADCDGPLREHDAGLVVRLRGVAWVQWTCLVLSSIAIPAALAQMRLKEPPIATLASSRDSGRSDEAARM